MTGRHPTIPEPLLIDALRMVARAKEDSSTSSIDAIAAPMKRSATAVRGANRLSIVVANLRRFSHFYDGSDRGFPPACHLAGKTSSLMTKNSI
jgi:hypothetical protein